MNNSNCENVERIKKYSVIVFIFALTLFSIFVFPVYKVLQGDQNIYVPEIKQELDPELFPNDYLFSFKQTNFTLFDEIVVFLVNNLKIDLFVLFFVLFVLFRFIYFYSIYKISFFFTQNKLFSIFSTLLFLNSYYIYSTLERVFILETHPRSISLALNLLFLALYFNRKKIISTIPLGLGLIIHPITSLPFITYYYLDIFFFSKKKLINLDVKSFLFGLIPVVWLFVLLLNTKSSGIGFLGLLDPLWESIIRFRDPYVFISSWTFLSIPFHISTLVLLVISWIELRDLFAHEIKRKLYLLVSIPISLTILSFLLVDILKLHMFAQLQMTRSLLILKLLVIIFFSFYGVNHIIKYPKDYLYNFSITGLLFSFMIKEAVSLIFLPLLIFVYLKRKFSSLSKCFHFINNKLLNYGILFFGIIFFVAGLLILITSTDDGVIFKKILIYIPIIMGISILELPISSMNLSRITNKKIIYASVGIIFVSLLFLPGFSIVPSFFNDSQFSQACKWIKENTGKDDIFLTEPFSKISTEIRIGCDRKVFFSYEDGPKCVFDKKYALEWYKRFKLIKLIEKNNIDNAIPLIKKERIDYIISTKSLNISAFLLFNNSKYYVYKT